MRGMEQKAIGKTTSFGFLTKRPTPASIEPSPSKCCPSMSPAILI